MTHSRAKRCTRRRSAARKAGWLLLLGFVLAGVLLAGREVAAVHPAAARVQEERLRVGVSHLPPFAIRHTDGWDGIAIHLWEQCALALDVPYELVEIEPGEGLPRLRAGELDVVITAVATVEAEEFADFTYSYYTTMLGFAESGERTLMEMIRAILSQRFLRITFWIVLALLMVGLLAWLFERQQNEEMFGGGPGEGIWSGFWWAAATLTTVGYGDKTPRSVGGRMVALVWMLAAVAITASLTATVTSVLTLGAASSTTFPEDLRQAAVGSVEGSASAEYLEEEGIQFSAVEDAVEGLRQVEEGELAFFVYDLAFLRYLNHDTFGETFTVVPAYTQANRYAFMLATDSEMREPLNLALLEEMNSARYQDLLNRFLPDVVLR